MIGLSELRWMKAKAIVGKDVETPFLVRRLQPAVKRLVYLP